MRNEANLLLQLIQCLGFDDENLKTREDLHYSNVPRRTLDVLLNHIKPNYCYEFNNKPIVIFKSFEFKVPDEIRQYMNKVWNFNETPIVFLVFPGEIQIHNGYMFDKRKGGLIKDKISSLDDEFLKNFSKWEIVTGNIFNLESKIGRFFAKSKRVDQQLLNNLVVARQLLIKAGLNESNSNTILGRCLFIQYLIDRGALSSLTRNKFLEVVSNKDNLYKLFNFLKGKFNGDLFDIGSNETSSLNQTHLNILHRLFSSEELASGQRSLFNLYDFSIIPVELISNIYERFLSDEERKDDKSVYTPLFLVDFILSQSLDEIVSKKEPKSIKVLDPSCGSGVFLVESFRRIYAGWLRENPNATNSEKANTLRSMLEKNIYGIDRNGNSIDIAVLSLYIATLDYLEPRDIEVNGFIFPVMKDKTLFVADTFDLEDRFNLVLESIEFDLIVGNPPWGTPKKQTRFLAYCKQNQIDISDKQIAQAFLYRCADFASAETEIAQVVTCKIIYNSLAASFRKGFLSSFLIEGYLDLSISANMGVFKDALGAGCVLFYRKASDEVIKANLIQHLVLRPNMFLEYFSTLALEKQDIKLIPQQLFRENDWAWKVLLHGSVFDFEFLKRLLDPEYTTMKAFLDSENIFAGAGFIRGEKNRKCSVEKLVQYPIVPTDSPNNLFDRFFIDENSLPMFRDVYPEADKFKDLGRLKAYEAPHLLVKRGINRRPVVAFTDRNCAFTNSVYGYSAASNKIKTLKLIGGLLSSDILTYLVFMLSPQWGVERGEALLNDYRNVLIPCDIPDNERSLIAGLFDEVSKEAKRNAEAFLSESTNSSLLQQINEAVNNLYSVDPTEKDFIDYASTYLIPFFRRKSSLHCDLVDDLNDFHEYCNVFQRSFNALLTNEDQRLHANLYINKYYAAVNFVFKNCDKYNGQDIELCPNELLASKLGQLGLTKITNELIIQKDVKGFETNSFFIIKTREKKNWHRAMARIDLSEIMDSIRNAIVRRNEE